MPFPKVPMTSMVRFYFHTVDPRFPAAAHRVHGPLSRGWLLLGLVLAGWLCHQPMLRAQSVAHSPALRSMTLKQVVAQILERNESLQIKQIEAEVSQKGVLAERGVYEPRVVTSIDHVDSRRQNNAQQQSSLLSTSRFEERNSVYSSGIEFLLPTGGKLNTGVTLRNLENNLQALRSVNREYEAFAGASLTQPLLKNFGPGFTESRIRIAALVSDLAFQEYRRQLMLIVARAESAYWDLYLTQEQERLTAESLSLAAAILEDNKSRAQLGQSSEIEVLKAQAGLNLREARHKDARLRRMQGAGQLGILLSDPGLRSNVVLYASDHPVVHEGPLTYYESYEQAFELNPDYVSRRKQAQQENVRLAFAKNQRLPQLDLKASYGLNGLESSPGAAWETAANRGFPSWSLGLEMRIPMLGGQREKNELEAAKLNRKKALLAIREMESQIAMALETALSRVRLQGENVTNYNAAVTFHDQLLKSQRERLEMGRVDTRSVLEIEEKLFEARLAVVDSLVQHKKGLIDLELVSGSILQTRGFDLTKRELHARTSTALQGDTWSPAALEKYAREANKGDNYGDLSPARLEQRIWLEKLRETPVQPPPPAQR